VKHGLLKYKQMGGVHRLIGSKDKASGAICARHVRRQTSALPHRPLREMSLCHQTLLLDSALVRQAHLHA
jgi:hypothetical protein